MQIKEKREERTAHQGLVSIFRIKEISIRITSTFRDSIARSSGKSTFLRKEGESLIT
jgi:hypothetical protein